MIFLLSSQNVTEYLVGQGVCDKEEQAQCKAEPKPAKNFNLLLSLPNERKLLIKQERYDQNGRTAGEFLREWRIQEFFQEFPELNHVSTWLSDAVHFDAEHSIIVFKYLNDHRDLADFYDDKNFPTAIATTIGAILAEIHRLTLNRQEYRDFLAQNLDDVAINQASNLTRDLARIGPEVFGLVPADGLKFFALYQRYDSLGKAIAELGTAFEPCCLTHNDFKLNNILLLNDWERVVSQSEQSDHRIIRVIDWERAAWGDPACDLGILVSSYLQLWLYSLVTSNSITIEESLRLATTPLELVQPSIAALAGAYFEQFPEILERRPDFLKRVVQFAGLALITAIQGTLQYQKSFGNTGICMLQVAKTLLCRPETSITTVFGMSAPELTRRFSFPN